LAHRLAVGVSSMKEMGFAQLSVSDFLRNQIAREAARRLDDHCPRTIALDPFKQAPIIS